MMIDPFNVSLPDPDAELRARMIRERRNRDSHAAWIAAETRRILDAFKNYGYATP